MDPNRINIQFDDQLPQAGPVVQWIECEIPVLMIRVRIPTGLLFENLNACISIHYRRFVFFTTNLQHFL